MRTIFPPLVLFTLFLCATPAGVPAADAPTFEDVLEAVDRYYESLHTLEASFTQLVEVPALEKSETYRGRLYFLKPDYLRLEYDEPQGQLLVADGTWYWFYMPQPELPQAMRAPMEQKGAAPRYVLGGGMREKYTGRLLGEQVRNGIKTYVLDLEPIVPSPYYKALRAWVDASSFATRAVQYTDESGNLNIFDLFDLKPNVPISPGKFVFNPPPGTQILEAQ